MRRLGAAVVAVLMVVVALWVRGRIDDGGGGNGSSGDGVLRVRCATELAEVCNQVGAELDDVEFSTASAGATAAELARLPDARREESGFDAWLVPEPWPEIVDVRRGVNGLEPVFETPTDPIARSPLALVVRTDRRPVLEATAECGGAVTWRCVGEVAGRSWDAVGGEAQWGRVRPGHGNPTESAVGLLVLSQATTGFFEGAEQYTRFDLEDNLDYGDWLSDLEQSIPGFGSPFAEMLQQLPTAAFDVVGTTEAEAGPALARAARDRRRQLTLLYPEPVVTADVVLAPAIGADREAVDELAGGDELRTALAEHGWRVPGEPRAKGVGTTPALRARNGLPDDPGALVALQDVWNGTR